MKCQNAITTPRRCNAPQSPGIEIPRKQRIFGGACSARNLAWCLIGALAFALNVFPAETSAVENIYSLAKKGTYRIPPELDNFKKTQSPLKLVNGEAFGFEPKDWQSDPSRVIYHGGKYHCWMIDGYNHRYKKDGKSWILYMTSEDTYNWTAVHHVPLGPKGSCYDLAIEQANVVYHEGKFYLFSEGWTTNIEKYGQKRAGIFCLVADSPEGPWKQVGDVLLKPETDEGRSWDNVHVNNPRHVYLDGKWLMYYKSRRKPKGVKTRNGLAIADSLTGPYTKYEGNPLLWGHGHFCWRYKHGMLMLPFVAETMLWSEDGIHFTPPLATGKEKLFLFGSLYVPHDPLCGKPVTDKPVTKYWGLESVYRAVPDVPSSPHNWDVVRIEWGFGPSQRDQSSHPALSTVPFAAVKVRDAFWAPRLETNRKVTVPHSLKQLEKRGP